MSHIILYYQLPTAITVVLACVITWHAWQLRGRQGAEAAVLLGLAVAWWAIGSMFEVGSPRLEQKIFWTQVEYPGIVTVPVAWFLIMRAYFGQTARLSTRTILLIFLIPAATLVLLWTNDWHHLMYTDAFLDTSFIIPTITFARGEWFWVFYTTCISLIFIGIAYGFEGWSHAHPVYRRQLMALLVCVFTPFLINVSYVAHWAHLPALDYTPVAFILSEMVIVFGIKRYYLWDITPIARTDIFDRLPDGVLVFDLNHRLVDINQAGTRMLGLPRTGLIGMPVDRLAHTWPALAHLAWGEQEETLALEWAVPERHVYHGRMTPLITPTEQIGGWSLVLHDMTEQHQLAQELSMLAYYDSLTGLPNRMLMQDRLIYSLAQGRRSGLSTGIIFLDIDHFKEINDTLGHATGDAVLRAVAERLQMAVREADVVARVGGDEFVIVTPAIRGADDLAAAAERILDQFQRLLIIGERQFRLTPSLGLTIAPQQGETADRLLIQADQSMYKAKQSGRNRYVMYDEAGTVTGA